MQCLEERNKHTREFALTLECAMVKQLSKDFFDPTAVGVEDGVVHLLRGKPSLQELITMKHWHETVHRITHLWTVAGHPSWQWPMENGAQLVLGILDGTVGAGPISRVTHDPFFGF